MPGDNSQNSNTNSQSSANSATNATNATNDTNNANQNNDSQNNDNQDKGEKTIPYSRFQEVNSKFRDAEKELVAYKAKEKEANDAKLLEEKNFQELIGNKDKRIKELEAENGQIKTTAKKEKIEFTISSVLAKNNVIDAKDGLKFIDYNDLLDSDNAEDEINKRVGELVKNKAYLFKAGSNDTRSRTENHVPGNNQSQGQPQGKKSITDTLTESLARKLST